MELLTVNPSRPTSRQETASRQGEPRCSLMSLILRPNALIWTSLRTHHRLCLRLRQGKMRCAHQPSIARSSIPRPGQEPTKEANGNSMTAPMDSRTTTAPTTTNHGTAILTDTPYLTTMTGSGRNTRPSRTTINYLVHTGPISICHPEG
jgi:hypothetical protein